MSQQKNTVNDTVTGTYNFTYDDMGNITQITNASGVVQNKYYYDDLGQLTREDNRALNKTYLWTYDNAGNILRKRTYAFTTGALGTVLSTQSYTYGNASWGDLLTNVGDTSITYDAIGNPTTVRISNGESYDYGYNMTWQGRRLMSYTMFDNLETGMQLSTITYTYNVDGIRTSKTVNGIEHKYIVDGSRIVAETWTESGVEHFLVFVYDETGAPIGIKYRASSYAVGVFDYYFFEKNLQGDIIAIYNANGTKIGSYAYDAWGNFTVTKSSGISLLEYSILYNYNPFHYRGYYYDIETGLYYVSSRYYDPEIGRWINADSLLNQESVLGNNMFAYCLNNPVNMADTTGELPFLLVTAAIGAVAGAIIGGVVAAKNGGNVWAGIGIGAAAGALIGTGAGMAAGAALAGSITATTAQVAFGASTLATTVATGGLGAGVTYIANNLQQAGNEISNAIATTTQKIVSKTPANPGKPFEAGKTGIQHGVNPNTLIPQKDLSTLNPQRMANAVKFGGDQAVRVGRTRIIQDGHNRVADAIMNGRAIDIFVEPYK